MSAPAAVTEKAPDEYVVCPARAGLPMSCAVQGVGRPVAGVTVKLTPLLAWPPTVTATAPVVAPLGTGTTMPAALQLVGVAAIPLNVTVVVPRVAPRFAPVIVTGVPTPPDDGGRVVT